MRVKPPACLGCPAYGNGQGFVPDELVEQAPLLLVFQNPGEEEEQQGKPLVGRTGQMMEKNFFPLLGVQRGEVSLGNVLRCRWNHGNTLPPLANGTLQAAVDHCTKAHFRVPSGTKAILAAGEYAAFAMTGLKKGFSGWRGYARPLRVRPEVAIPKTSVWTPSPSEIPVLVTYHIAYLFRDPSAQVPLRADWQKPNKLVAREWPKSFPPVHTDPPAKWPSVAAFDTEFHGGFQHPTLVRYSLATPERRVWVVEASEVGHVPVAPGSQIILHNAPVDVPHLSRVVDLTQVQLDDTMLAHAVLYGGREPKDGPNQRGGAAFAHNLNYLGSLYGQTNRHKHLEYINPIQYSAGDALHTMDAWVAMQHEFNRDPLSRQVYERYQRPLLPILLTARARGLRVNQERVKSAITELTQGQEEQVATAQAAVGWPINLQSGKQVSEWLYQVEKVA